MQGLTPRLSNLDPNPSKVQFEGDLEPPVTSYASTGSTLNRPGVQDFAQATAWTRSPVVDRHARMDGMRFNYGYGPEEAALPQTYPGGNDGQVRRSAFQTIKNHLYNFVKYDGLFSAGYPRNLGLTFRVAAIQTNRTGAPGKSQMDPTPRFNKVQTIPRYSVVPPSYPTRSANS